MRKSRIKKVEYLSLSLPKAWVDIDTSTYPFWLVYYHKFIRQMSGDAYLMDTAGWLAVRMRVTAVDRKQFPELEGVEDVWVGYGRGIK